MQNLEKYNDRYIFIKNKNTLSLSLSKKERTRNWIIEKAAALFNEKGYINTSISDLAKATQMTSGAIYGSFENKQDLIAEAFDYNVDKLFAAHQQQIQKYENVQAKLFLLLDFPVTRLFTLFNGGCPILNAAIEADDTMPWLREKVKLALDRWIVSIKTLLDEGIQSGEFEKINTEAYSIFLISAIEGAVMLANTTKGVMPIQITTAMLKEDFENRVLVK